MIVTSPPYNLRNSTGNGLKDGRGGKWPRAGLIHGYHGHADDLPSEAAGSLAEELPWWGWLEDGRSCLTRAGELLTIGRVTPSVLDGQTPEQLDRVIDRWQRMLSGVDSRTRLYFYLLRRPVRFEDEPDGAVSDVAALGRVKRQAFLEERVQSVSAYVAWAHDPGLSAVTTQKTGGPWWMAYAKNWMARRRNQHESHLVALSR